MEDRTRRVRVRELRFEDDQDDESVVKIDRISP